jgi:hypothetical protein
MKCKIFIKMIKKHKELILKIIAIISITILFVISFYNEQQR